MPKYSILMRVSPPVIGPFPRPNATQAIASVLAQTSADWELVLVGTPDELAWLGPQDPRVRTVEAPGDEPLAWTANRLLATLGSWIGFLGQDDALQPTTLAQLDAGMSAQPSAKVLFTDEESRNWFGQISLRFRKGAINPLRLRHQEYLREFTVVDRATVAALGGYSRLASHCPAHDLYLRILENHGPDAFRNIPERLYQRYRDHRDSKPRGRFDLQAVKDHLTRLAIPAHVARLNGTIDIDYGYPDRPEVTVLVVVTDDLPAGLRQIQRSQQEPLYRPAVFRILHLGTDPVAAWEYRSRGKALQMQYTQSDLVPAAAFNYAARRIDSPYLCLLQGRPINGRWLHRLVDHARLPGTGAVGARCMTGTRLHQPGVLGHRYEGWDWNTAGRFDVLTVPHQVCAVSPACLLIDTRLFLQFDGFNTAYPTLHGMDLCLRLDQAGYANLLVPASQAEVTPVVVPAAEADALSAAWPGWSDRFGLHLPLQQ